MAGLEIATAYNLLRGNMMAAGLERHVPIVDTLEERGFARRSYVKIPDVMFTPADVVFRGEDALLHPDSNHVVTAVNRLVYLAASEPARAPLALTPDHVVLTDAKTEEVLLIAGIPTELHLAMQETGIDAVTNLGVNVSLNNARPYGSNKWRMSD